MHGCAARFCLFYLLIVVAFGAVQPAALAQAPLPGAAADDPAADVPPAPPVASGGAIDRQEIARERLKTRGGIGAFIPMSSTLDPEPLRLQYENTVGFRESVGGQDARFGYVDQDLRLSLPIAQDGQRQWLLNTRLRGIDFDTPARFPESRRFFPGELYDLTLGTTYRARLDNGWIGGFNVNVGSPSDVPFASSEEIALVANGFVRIPAGERNAWHIFLNVSNIREFAQFFPLPGFGYEFHTDSGIDGLAGFPFSQATWRATDWLTARATYLFPRMFDAELAFRLAEASELYVGYEAFNERFLPSERPDDDDRLFRYEQRVKGGLRHKVGAVSLELEGGFAFDRFYFYGEEFDDRNDDRLNIADGPYLQAQVRIAF